MESQPQQQTTPRSWEAPELGVPLTLFEKAKIGIAEKGALDEVELALDTLEKNPEQVARARQAVERHRARQEQKRMEVADAIDQAFRAAFLQNLIRLKSEPRNANVPAQALYLKAAEIAAPAALAEAKRRDPNLPEDLVHDEMMKAYTGTLQRIGALQPDHDLSAEDIQTIQRILKTEQIGISSEEGASAPEGPSIEGKRFASSGGKSEAAFEEADQTKGEDRSEGGPSMFRLSDMQ